MIDRASIPWLAESWIPAGMDAVKASVRLGAAGYRLRDRWEVSAGLERNRLRRLIGELLQPGPMVAAAVPPSEDVTAAMLEAFEFLSACGEYEVAARAADVLAARSRRRAREQATRRFAALRARVDASRPALVAAAQPPVAPVVSALARQRQVRRLSTAQPVRKLSAAAPVRKLSVPSRVGR